MTFGLNNFKKCRKYIYWNSFDKPILLITKRQRQESLISI